MLPRPKRLDRASFGSVASGKRAATRHFSISLTPSPSGRAAVVVSKKVAKKSVDRHLLKRRVLAVLAADLPAQYACIVYARAGSPTLSFKALAAEIQELLSSVRKV